MIFSGSVNAGVRQRFIAHHPGLHKLEAWRSEMIYAHVAIDNLVRELGDRLFTYLVPDALRQEVFIGSQVLVPLGQQLLSGYVIAIEDGLSQAAAEAKFQIKPIVDVLESEPLFDAPYVEFLYFVADYYAASIAEVISAAVTADLGPKVKRIVRLVSQPAAAGTGNKILDVLAQARGNALAVRALKQRTGLPSSKFYATLAKLRHEGIVKVERESEAKMAPKVVHKVIWSGAEAQTAKQAAIVSALKRTGGESTVSALAEAASTTPATIKKMCVSGILLLLHDEVMRDPLAHLAGSHPTGNGGPKLPQLTDHQQIVFDTLKASLEQRLLRPEQAENAPAPWLLHGVTGSGKTEIYLRLIDVTLQNRRTALMLVPEISLTPQLAQRLVERFGDKVAIWHSGLSAGERFDTWRRLRAGQAKVLLGARSAVLANIPDLGLLILDEEHDSSYKQSSPSPRYHAKKLAIERARRCGAMVLLGSATPDVATFFECRDAGKIVELPERVYKQELPKSSVVDMRLEYSLGNKGIFSRALLDAIAGRLSAKEQIILLMNRRGYASHVFCRACGFVTKCKNCSVSLVLHQINEGYLMCHHCGYKALSWQTCPSCQGPFVKQLGLGTQRVEEEVATLFPEARILRLDSDVTSKRGAYEEIFRQFVGGEADILIGTQIVAKGLDIPRVTLVGVLAADSAFNLPDYRSVERGFQLLTQVSGRAGRGQAAGHVILQTYNTDLPALELARKQDYGRFVKEELSSREAFDYPPFSQIVRVVIAGEDDELVEHACEQLAEELSQHLDEQFTEEEISIVGPAPCLIQRLKNKWRHHLLIKNRAGEPGRTAIARFLKLRRSTPELSLAIDIDAVDLL